MKVICNSLYKPLIRQEYWKDIQFLNNEECDCAAENYNLEEVELAIFQPFYANKTFLDRMPRLRAVQVTSAGYDRVDTDELKRRNIILCNTRGVMSISIAEDVFAKILFFSRQIRRVEEDKRNHVWDMFGQDQWMCSCYTDLYRKTLGIMGYGSIGSEIAKRAHAFGMNIHVYDAIPQSDPVISKCFVGEEKLPSFYAGCDYIVICIPLNEKTKYMLNYEAFQQMKNSAILINIARGPLVKTDDLIKALRNGEVQAAALDVFELEPLPQDHEIWTVDNIFISSHKAGMGDSWKMFIGELIMRNIDNYMSGADMENVIRL